MIFQRQALVRRPGGGDRLQPQVAPDPVVQMHHQVAGGQRLVLGQEVLGPAALAGPADQPVAEHVLLRDHGDAAIITGTLEALLQPPDHQVDAGLHILPAFRRARALQPMIGQ